MGIPIDVQAFAFANFCSQGRHIILSRSDKECRACKEPATENDYLFAEESMREAAKLVWDNQPKLNLKAPMTRHGRATETITYENG